MPELLIAGLIAVAYIGAGLLINWKHPIDGDSLETGAYVFFGPLLVLALSPFLILGWIARKIEKVLKRA